MKKKMHRVAVVLYVMAEDEFEACWAAANAHFEVFECAAEEAKIIDPGWEDGVPYNSEDDRTCSEIFGDQRQAGDSVTKTIKLPCAWATKTAGLKDTGRSLVQPEHQSRPNRTKKAPGKPFEEALTTLNE